jgi:dienelactone hydrolase
VSAADPDPLVVLVADDPAAARLAEHVQREGLAVRLVSGPDAAARAVEAGSGDSLLAVVGWGDAGEAALVAAAGASAVAVALVASPLSPEVTALVAEWPEVPVLAVADALDRPALKGAVDAYLASGHDASDIRVGPIDDGALGEVAAWLRERMTVAPIVDEVELASSDGWTLHATRSRPRAAGPVPGVVLLHSGRSDRAAFARLERLLVERGLAVLNVDWRGRGQSTGRGTYDELGATERADGWRDAAAALDHLAACEGVDDERLAAVGVIHGAEHAVRAAQRDPRVRAIGLLTGYRPGSDEERAYLTSGQPATLYVTARDQRVTTEAMSALHRASPPGRSRYVEYPGAAIGYQLFELDPTLEPTIAAWLAEVLAP